MLQLSKMNFLSLPYFTDRFIVITSDFSLYNSLYFLYSIVTIFQVIETLFYRNFWLPDGGLRNNLIFIINK